MFKFRVWTGHFFVAFLFVNCITIKLESRQYENLSYYVKHYENFKAIFRDVDMEQRFRHELLELTTVLPEKGQFRYYTQTELELMAYMGQMLRFQKKYDEGIGLLENVIYNQTQSRVSWIYQWNGLDFVFRVLGGLYFAVGKYEDSNTMEEYVHFTNLQILCASNLPQALDAIADNLEHIGQQYSEKYKELYSQTYYAADFFACTDIILFTDKYYKENFAVDINWY